MNLNTAIEDFLLYIQVEKNYSEHTVLSYEYDLKSFFSFLADYGCSTELNDITKLNVRRFIQHLLGKRHQSPRSLNRKISCLKSFTKYCVREKYINHDFMFDIETPKTDEKLVVYLTTTDLQHLFRALEQDHTRFSKRNEVMIKLLATTGMRRSELVSLTWQQLDFSNQTIRIHGKGKKERLLPLHLHLIPLLVTYKASLQAYQIYSTEHVFLNKDGKILDPRGLHSIFKKVLKKAGLPPSRFSLHHLRHTFATLMLQENKENVDLRVLQELLGHESITSTEVYTHVEFQQKKKAIDSFNLFND
ncbi:tyrosine-type recombinase/integrase [Lysinibacillus sp. SGAir0095]|uniref:tyrosine-type recombinase/integrase n=1 Tax=Lysinibacillus sp. SGAir0095 TaxID=2070463 RepID=UPI0010CD1D84|nr:tyrosine-type recombinase/integrase [Lysinibacillus sp. SGAir0095]QCR32545.1 integrase [Lysinibacillus sp. SGAir0095]